MRPFYMCLILYAAVFQAREGSVFAFAVALYSLFPVLLNLPDSALP